MANTEITLQNLGIQANNVTSATDILTMYKIVDSIKTLGTLDNTFPSLNDLATANTSNKGHTAFVANKGLYVCNGSDWIAIANTEYKYGGEYYGYSSADNGVPTATSIDQFSFTSDGNATNVGDLTVGKYGGASASSPSYGYCVGGYSGGTGYGEIEKFPFASPSDGATTIDAYIESIGSYNSTYRAGGYNNETYGFVSLGPGPTSVNNPIYKWPFSSDSNETNVGDMGIYLYGVSGSSSLTHGYASGGYNPTLSPAYVNDIKRFPFAISDASASDVGDLASVRRYAFGHSSETHGYTAGGDNVSDVSDIDKFPFASSANATKIGDLTTIAAEGSSSSSVDYGYSCGGQPAPLHGPVIDKFPFASDANATDVGDLTLTRVYAYGNQH